MVYSLTGKYNATAKISTTTPIAINTIGNLTSEDNITVEDVPVNNKGIVMLPTGNSLLVALFALLIIPVRPRRK